MLVSELAIYIFYYGPTTCLPQACYASLRPQVKPKKIQQ